MYMHECTLVIYNGSMDFHVHYHAKSGELDLNKILEGNCTVIVISIT